MRIVTTVGILLTGCAAMAQGIAAGPGGTILKDGKPFRGIGINYFSVFSRTLDNADDTSYLKGLDELAKRGIPFIRFMGGGFWPNDWALYRDNPTRYFELMDAVVKAAEERHIGLIPSLFWWYACIPDVVGEPINQWGNPESKTIAFMRKYVEDVVGRYKDSPAIWAWELGNEYSLAADLPNAADHRPWAKPDLGTPASRSEADDLRHDMVVTACTEFATAVRKIDAKHLITTGHSLPRPAAEHMRRELSWKQDSVEELQKNLLDVTPDPCNLVSIHVYPFEEKGRFNQQVTPYKQVLDACLQVCVKAGKPLFVGEFGAPDDKDGGGPEVAKTEFMKLLSAIEESAVPLAALWVFDLPLQDSFINITADNQRSYQLDAIQEANRRLGAHAR